MVGNVLFGTAFHFCFRNRPDGYPNQSSALAMSGSGAMFASAMHSLADSINQGFVFVGSILAEKKPTRQFPTGSGLVTILIADPDITDVMLGIIEDNGVKDCRKH